MTSFSSKQLAFPGNSNPLTERRVSAQAWTNALRPYFRYVHVSEAAGSVQVVVENGQDMILTLTESREMRDHWPLWTLSVYTRRGEIEYYYKVGNLQDVLTYVLREI